jgi:hypothetical protein
MKQGNFHFYKIYNLYNGIKVSLNTEKTPSVTIQELFNCEEEEVYFLIPLIKNEVKLFIEHYSTEKNREKCSSYQTFFDIFAKYLHIPLKRSFMNESRVNVRYINDINTSYFDVGYEHIFPTDADVPNFKKEQMELIEAIDDFSSNISNLIQIIEKDDTSDMNQITENNIQKAVLTHILLYTRKLNLVAKNIDKITLSSFDNEELIAQAVMKGYCSEYKDGTLLEKYKEKVLPKIISLGGGIDWISRLGVLTDVAKVGMKMITGK